MYVDHEIDPLLVSIQYMTIPKELDVNMNNVQLIFII